MIIANPDEQVWNMLTGGAGCSSGRQEIDKLKRMLKEVGISLVVDHDDRYHWIRLRSRRDLQIIQVKADVLVDGDGGMLEFRYADQTQTGLNAEETFTMVRESYGEENQNV